MRRWLALGSIALACSPRAVAPTVSTSPSAAPVAIADAPAVDVDASAPDEPAQAEPKLVVALHAGVAHVTGEGFEPGERVTVSLDEHDDAQGYGDCRGEPVTVKTSARGTFHAYARVPACAAALCFAPRRALGATAEWACGLDCSRAIVENACPSSR